MQRVSLLLLLCILLFAITANAQSFGDKVELGVSTGGIKYIGGATNPSLRWSGSILGKYALTDQFQIRMQLMAGTIASNPAAAYSNPPPDVKPFRMAIAEISILPEYDLINIQTGKATFTPYIFAGVSYIYYKRHYKLLDSISGTTNTYKYPLTKVPPILNIPIGIGIKYAVSSDVKLFAEGSFRWYSNKQLYSFALGFSCRWGFLQNLFSNNDNQDNHRINSNKKLSSKCPPVYL